MGGVQCGVSVGGVHMYFSQTPCSVTCMDANEPTWEEEEKAVPPKPMSASKLHDMAARMSDSAAKLPFDDPSLSKKSSASNVPVDDHSLSKKNESNHTTKESSVADPNSGFDVRHSLLETSAKECFRSNACRESFFVMPPADADETPDDSADEQRFETPSAPLRRQQSSVFHAEVSHRHSHDPEQHRADGYGSESDSSDDDAELEEDPMLKSRQGRRDGLFNTKFGPWNKRYIGSYQVKETAKSTEHHDVILHVVKHDELFVLAVERNQTELIVRAFEVITPLADSKIVELHESATDFYIVLDGYVEVTTFLQGEECSTERLEPGEYFGDEALMWHTKWSLSATAGPHCVLGKISRSCYQAIIVERGMQERDRRIACLHKVSLFETFNDEQIAKLEEVLHLRVYHPGDVIVREGQPGHHFFILESGECHVFKGTQNFYSKPHAILGVGSLFGERALLDNTPRTASVIAKTDVELLVLSRGKFERLLGTMQQIHESHAKTDPRHLIAKYFESGTTQGPRGHVEMLDDCEDLVNPSTRWFAVFRPTSRDAITKLISQQGVGKGLNIKGKSAKKGALSGFVPFLQISKNEHKHDIEASPAKSWIKVFYRSHHSRDHAFQSLSKILNSPEHREHIELENPDATAEELLLLNDEYEPESYGITLPETVLHEAYIELEDLTPHAGWETGRASEPAFMDMNLHSIRGKSSPQIVLWQYDEAHPMNPHGLLMAYAEAKVKPVVSDFDAFVISSYGHLKYSSLSDEQVKLQQWALDKTEGILMDPNSKSWTSRWLEVLADLAASGEHHDFPTFGYGDDTSVGFVQTAVAALRSSGGIRHGAECFNFHFPQELDDEYLIIWEGVKKDNPSPVAQPFKYTTEKGLREFLIARANEGYTFPLNPVWPIRDPGWYEVFKAAQAHPNNKQAFEAWYPKSSGILDRIEELAQRFPERFKPSATRASQNSTDAEASKLEKAESILHQVKRIAQGVEGIRKNGPRLKSLPANFIQLKTGDFK